MPSKPKLEDLLNEFVLRNKFRSPGALCVALVFTHRARAGLPLDPRKLLTPGGGQVKGLGKPQVQTILAKHGIVRVLVQMGGRTSRGSVRNTDAYVQFLNSLAKPIDLDAVEKFWVSKVRAIFAAKPFKFRADSSLSIRAAVRDLLQQARSRQAELPGSRFEGTMLQHLIGAKLEMVLPANSVSHHSASEADQAEGRAGDFVIGDVSIHVTTHPGEGLIRKCADNIHSGLRPLIVTLPRQTAAADTLAENAELQNRIDILDVEQFLAANVHERGLFQAQGRIARTKELVNQYNQLIDKYETDPSLKIQLLGS